MDHANAGVDRFAGLSEVVRMGVGEDHPHVPAVFVDQRVQDTEWCECVANTADRIIVPSY